ncbi:MAG TPA: flavin prenyltransferase UbiX [Leptospiraceae bacterium]|nr:flavin prenyltransferase UbiX [Leptospiraceae bacterium]HMW07515.1 flavin prenyltransferase UbiX [Leptospiraceae bacterium]HMX35352.1 flavin prenyltransferase UbiX [Leptospiraceae bacterium]HMY33091.1 flavin prenyltransferase UbiX [Leptospiraceae bacterium]HMZ64217.1 flavin prenyltransferase UbiX [Leptospiraceae bacterium]
MKLVLGIAGASGSIYPARFIKKLLEIKGETFLIISPASIRIFREEYETKVNTAQEILDFIINRWEIKNIQNQIHFRSFQDIGADIASGSNTWDGMVVLPCSMKTIASINAGLTENLIERCADVTLKERRRLILVPRETPYNQIHLRNMLSLDQAGAIILPASPGFYQMPKTLDDLGDFIAGRIFNLLGVNADLFPKWEG